MLLTITFSVFISFQNVAQRKRPFESKVVDDEIKKGSFSLYAIEYVE